MNHIVYGYIRVSAKDQKEDRQLLALQQQNILPKNIYLDKQSGKDFARPAYQSLMRKVKSGDTIVITTIDRLGRNYNAIIEQWRYITVQKKAFIIVLDMPLLNSAQEHDLTGELISNLMLQLLSYVAEMERRLIRQRQKEGIVAAQARGVKFGRPKKSKPEQYLHYLKQWHRGEISASAAARALGVHYQTFLNWAKNDASHLQSEKIDEKSRLYL